MEIEKQLHLYVLQLANGRYYVGRSANLNVQAAELGLHGGGQRWIQENQPAKLLYKQPIEDETLVRDVTLGLMREHGWENVRGWGWSQTNLKQAPLALREEEPKKVKPKPKPKPTPKSKVKAIYREMTKETPAAKQRRLSQYWKDNPEKAKARDRAMDAYFAKKRKEASRQAHHTNFLNEGGEE